jgi:hypothetical protein
VKLYEATERIRLIHSPIVAADRLQLVVAVSLSLSLRERERECVFCFGPCPPHVTSMEAKWKHLLLNTRFIVTFPGEMLFMREVPTEDTIMNMWG